jgi:hypothetical protein
MPNRYDESEPHEDRDADDPEAPQACDVGADELDDDTPTVPCPSCRAPVYEFADRCPSCGEWIVPSGGDASRRNPAFVVFVVLIVVALLFLWVF